MAILTKKDPGPDVATIEATFLKAAREHRECRAAHEALVTRLGEIKATINLAGVDRGRWRRAKLEEDEMDKQALAAEEQLAAAQAVEAAASRRLHAAKAVPFRERARALIRTRQALLDRVQAVEGELQSLQESADQTFAYGLFGQTVVPREIRWPEFAHSTPIQESLIDLRRRISVAEGWLP